MKKKIALVLALTLCLAFVFALSVFAETSESVSSEVSSIENGEGAEEEMNFHFDGGSLGQTMPILCTGMLGIFIVTGVIIAIVLALNTTMTVIDAKKQAKKQDKQ